MKRLRRPRGSGSDKKLMNRMAAKRCRDKRKVYVESLESKVEGLERELEAMRQHLLACPHSQQLHFEQKQQQQQQQQPVTPPAAAEPLSPSACLSSPPAAAEPRSATASAAASTTSMEVEPASAAEFVPPLLVKVA